MGAGEVQWIDGPASEVSAILDKVASGEVIGVAATLIYKDGRVEYVPIGCAPDPLAGIRSFTEVK